MENHRPGPTTRTTATTLTPTRRRPRRVVGPAVEPTTTTTSTTTQFSPVVMATALGRSLRLRNRTASADAAAVSWNHGSNEDDQDESSSVASAGTAMSALLVEKMDPTTTAPTTKSTTTLAESLPTTMSPESTHHKATLARRRHSKNRPRRLLYVNLVVLDPSGVVAQHLDERKNMPRPVRLAAHFVAKRFVTPDKVAKVLAGSLPHKIQTKGQSKGLDLDVHVVFHQGPYLVLELELCRVHVPRLMETLTDKNHTNENSSNTEDASQSHRNNNNNNNSNHMSDATSLSVDSSSVRVWFVLQLVGVLCLGVAEFWCWVVGMDVQGLVERVVVPPLVQSRLQLHLNQLLVSECKDQGLDARSAVLPETQQATYFFDQLAWLAERRPQQDEDHTTTTAGDSPLFHRRPH